MLLTDSITAYQPVHAQASLGHVKHSTWPIEMSN